MKNELLCLNKNTLGTVYHPRQVGGLIPIANENGKVVKIKVYIKVLPYLASGQSMNRVAKFIKTLILVLLYLRDS